MLTIEADLPIAVSGGEPATNGAFDSTNATANLQLLRALNLLTLGARSDYGDSAAEASHDIARIEAKLDMLLLLMGSLVAEKVSLPPTRAVRFNAESVVVAGPPSHAVGEPVVVTFYPSAEIPRAVVLRAVVAHAVDEPQPGVTLDLGPMEDALRDEFERYIFLRHRRELALRSQK